MAFETLSDEKLFALLERLGAVCEKVMADPNRDVIPENKHCAPSDSAHVSALFAFLAMQEAERRGLNF